jgi:hypothetical protein
MKRGPKPLGNKAMTAAERQTRYGDSDHHRIGSTFHWEGSLRASVGAAQQCLLNTQWQGPTMRFLCLLVVMVRERFTQL